MQTRFNEVNRSIDQLRQQLSTIDTEIDRVDSDHRRANDEVKTKLRTLKTTVHDAVEFCDEVRQVLSQAQREVSTGGYEQRYQQQQQPLFSAGGGGGINPQQLAWELTQVITRVFQQAGIAPQAPFGGANANAAARSPQQQM